MIRRKFIGYNRLLPHGVTALESGGPDTRTLATSAEGSCHLAGSMAALSMTLAALGGAVPVAALRDDEQSDDEPSAHVALIYTPVAALPPLPLGTDTTTRTAGPGVMLRGRIGRRSRRGGLSLDTVGVGVELPVGRESVGGTLAYASASSGALWVGDNNGAGDIMLRGCVRTTLASRPLSSSTSVSKGSRRMRASNEGTFLVEFDGSLGFSPRQGEQAITRAAGKPTGILFASGNVRILPFLTPGRGFGRPGHVAYFADETFVLRGTFAFMLGGGLGLDSGTSALGAALGFQKVFTSNGSAAQLGRGMRWKGVTMAR